MAFNMKEVASLRGDDKKFQENFSKIDWSGASKEKEVCEKCKGEGHLVGEIVEYCECESEN